MKLTITPFAEMMKRFISAVMQTQNVSTPDECSGKQHKQ